MRTPRQGTGPAPVALTELNAVAYRLKVAHPGRPHLVEIVCAANRKQRGAVCVIEGDSRGLAVPLGPECPFAGGLANGNGAQRPAQAEDAWTHRQIFWPNDREPVLVLAGREAGRPLEISRIQLYEFGERLIGPPGPSSRLEASDGRPDQRPRLIGSCLDLDHLARNFCGPRSDDPAHQLAGDDWQTFWLAGSRLTEYLQYQQQNVLLLSVSQSSAKPESTRPIDGEAALAEERYPSSSDILELLFRLFDRERLVLIPELRFDGPLAAIDETSNDSQGKTDDLLLVDGSGGKSEAKENAPHGARAQYNPLSPHVQQAVQDVVAGFVERYGAHPSFGGLAFRLGPRSCLQLPGIEWGYDPASIRRFEHSTQARIARRPDANNLDGAYRILTTTSRREWVRFRTGEIAAFHRRLAELVIDARPDAHVLFSGHLASTDDAEPAAALIGVVRAGVNPARTLAEQGLDFSLPPYSTDSHVTVLRPVAQVEAPDVAAQAAAASLNLSPAVDALYRGASPGGLLHPVAQHSQFPLFRSPTGLPWQPAPVSVQTMASQRAADASVAQLLASLDAQILIEGAGAIPLVPVGPARRAPAALSRLPNIPFRASGPQIQPVVVRSAVSEKSTWIYAVNASSLPVTAELMLDCPATTSSRSLIDGERLPLATAPGGKSRVRIQLAGNDVWAVRFEHPGLAVSETQVACSDEMLAEMQRRIELLNANMKAASRASTKPTADENPRAATASGARQAGWDSPVRQADSLDGNEVRQLTKTVSSVKLAWEEGRYADCERMLDGYWGQLLLSMPVESPPAPLPRPKFTGHLREKLKR